MTSPARGRRGRTGRTSPALWVGSLLLLLLGGCTFERRVLPGDEAGVPAPDAGDSIRMVVSSLDEALRDGDLAAARSLFDADARISSMVPSPGEDGGSWRSPDAALGSDIPPGGGGAWTLVDSSVEVPTPGTAVVLNQYAAAGDPPGSARVLETLVLVRREGAWRIRHLHRSFPHPPGATP